MLLWYQKVLAEQNHSDEAGVPAEEEALETGNASEDLTIVADQGAVANSEEGGDQKDSVIDKHQGMYWC